jgi:hypothetical protein
VEAGKASVESVRVCAEGSGEGIGENSLSDGPKLEGDVLVFQPKKEPSFDGEGDFGKGLLSSSDLPLLMTGGDARVESVSGCKVLKSRFGGPALRDVVVLGLLLLRLLAVSARF